ncbi:competence protein ComL [Chryseobacterium camelliae]|uniref:Competence protein ComL n=1 Tax=Chryseobacterium camelliae TaxID=1265445 RepID=A0ABY7QT21_9FLAO|nr:DUF6759 domain-containing protein [Chryseobacterium camelliae]WBV61988.1 competence protein ComL [Chryseobacterium camelliae]
MKEKIIFGIGLSFLLSSCSTHYNTTSSSAPKSAQPRPTSTPSASQTEQEYNSLIKTYKPETAEVLTDLFNNSSNDPKTSITVTNKSRCNMVLSITGKNYSKKIPIAAGKIGYAMVLKNQNYSLSGMVCNSVYKKTQYISSSYSITLSN